MQHVSQQEYRAFILGEDGKIVRAEELVAPDDAAAREYCRQWLGEGRIDLWSGGRRVGVIEPPQV